jgi:hypothetical protein
MAMELSLAIQKAALLLDLKGDVQSAELLLRSSLAEHKELTPDRLRAQIFLGELLVSQGRPEGLSELQEAVSAPQPSEWDDLIGNDLARARRLLAE